MQALYYNILEERSVITVYGDDAATFLQGILTIDINDVNDHRSGYGCILTPQGKYLYDFFVSFWNNKFYLECSKGKLTDIIRKLTIYKLRSQVMIEDVSNSLTVLNISGNTNKIGLEPQEGFKVNLEKGFAYTDPRTNLIGGRMVVEKNYCTDLINQNSIILSSHSYNYMRIEAGIPEGDYDLIADKSFPLEYNYDKLNAISFTKGCYVGQEVTARTKHRGVVRKAIYKIVCDNDLPVEGTEILADGIKIGTLTSRSGNIGLALIRIEEYQQAVEQCKILQISDYKVNIIPTKWN